MGYYRDLREHITALEAKDKLVRIKGDINKDTELMPLVRWQFRGLPEEQRKAFMFENVVDVKGKKYDIPVLVACHAASKEVYAIGMMCKPEEIMEKWSQAQLHPNAVLKRRGCHLLTVLLPATKAPRAPSRRQTRAGHPRRHMQLIEPL